MKLKAIVQEFADCVAAQADAIARGDSTAGNKFAKRYIAAFSELREYADEGRNALVCLLEDTRAEVRAMTAAYLLRHCEKKSRMVLEAEAQGVGFTAFGAAQALIRWKEGTWTLDLA
jgi:hypothetical protein